MLKRVGLGAITITCLALAIHGCGGGGGGGGGSVPNGSQPQGDTNTSAPFVSSNVIADSVTGEQVVADQVIVNFTAGASTSDISSFTSGNKLQQVGTFPPTTYQFKILDGRTPRDVLTAISNDPIVAGAASNHVVSATHTPYKFSASDYTNPVKLVNALESWTNDIQNARGSDAVIIAILDTGLGKNLDDFKGRDAINWSGLKITNHAFDFVNADQDPYDDGGHGTKVASIACSTGDNGTGIAGMDWGCSVLALKVLDKDGHGDEFNVAHAILWATSVAGKYNKKLVINLSLGFTSNPLNWIFSGKQYPFLQNAIDFANSNGAIVVAAAGNDGVPVTGVLKNWYPATFTNVICVGAANAFGDGRWSSSNYGPEVDIAAPGEAIDVLLPDGSGSFGSGTSFAAPFVSGVVSRIWAVNSSLTNTQVTQTVLSNTNPLPNADPTKPIGQLLDAHKAIDAAAGQPGANAPTITSIQPTSGPTGGGTQITITGTGFITGTTIAIGGAALVNPTIVSTTSIIGQTPAGTTGAKDITATNSNGTGTKTGAFTYTGTGGAAPTVTSIAPPSGPTTGGTAVTINGSGFVSGTTITIGGASLSALTIVNPTTITGTTPAGSAGAKDVVATNANGSGTLFGGFTYTSTAPNTWVATANGAPAPRNNHTAVWTGTRMIVWGGVDGTIPAVLGSGGIFDPSAGTNGTWTGTTSTTNAPAARNNHTAVWDSTGQRMFIWGGQTSTTGTRTNTGSIYNATSNTWTTITTTGAPSARSSHTSIWTGTQMIVWGGYSGSVALNTGGIFNPASGTWTTTSTIGAPSVRYSHTAVWTGTRMIVWGGTDGTSYFGDGAAYDPGTNTWTPISAVGAPAQRSAHSEIWTGTLMLVWGGQNSVSLNTGGMYNPTSDTWTAMSTVNAPAAKTYNPAVLVAGKMIVWGGYPSNNQTGGVFDPNAGAGGTWTATTLTNAPSGRNGHTAVSTGTQMIVWAGYVVNAPVSDGGIYTPP